MITPRFDIEQDDEFLNINIHINNIRFTSSGVEVNINENVLIFHLSPYYLRLRFDHNLVDDERATANFISGESKILIKAPKANKGEHFNDLDLHSKLLARVNIGDNVNEKAKQGSLIQEIGGSNEQEKVEDIAKLGETFDWEIEQVEESAVSDDILNHAFKYGFNNSYSGLIGISVSNGNDINDLSDPEHTNNVERVKQRIQRENNAFDDEYYASEYITYKHGSGEDLEINRIKNILEYVPSLVQDYQNWIKENPENREAIFPVEFTTSEHTQMTNNLPRKEYLLDGETIKLNYITILNLLFSFNFECMENEGEHTSESVWTIGKLTPQIACLDQQLVLPESATDDNENKPLMKELTTTQKNRSERSAPKSPESIIKSAIVAGIRRSLCFPLHRTYELSKKAWANTFYILKGGKRLVIRNLLAIHELFRFHDVYYVYDKCLLDDLCAWFISQGNETVVRSLALELELQLSTLTKNDVEFECLADVNMETGETSIEKVSVRELEYLSEQMYQESISNPVSTAT